MIPELEWWEVLVRLGVAAGLTGAIGLERELRERAAGPCSLDGVLAVRWKE